MEEIGEQAKQECASEHRFSVPLVVPASYTLPSEGKDGSDYRQAHQDFAAIRPNRPVHEMVSLQFQSSDGTSVT